MLKKILVFTLIAVVVLTLTACVPGDGTYTNEHPANFLWGIWHGWVAPVSLIISIFNPDIRVYETANTGWWYDFGFYIAIISGFGGVALTRRARRRKTEE